MKPYIYIQKDIFSIFSKSYTDEFNIVKQVKYLVYEIF